MPQKCRKRREDADMSNIRGKRKLLRECTALVAETEIGVVEG